MLETKDENYAKLNKTSNYVILAKAGIQYSQAFPRFRVKPGMTNRGILQRSQKTLSPLNEFYGRE